MCLLSLNINYYNDLYHNTIVDSFLKSLFIKDILVFFQHFIIMSKIYYWLNYALIGLLEAMIKQALLQKNMMKMRKIKNSVKHRKYYMNRINYTKHP